MRGADRRLLAADLSAATWQQWVNSLSTDGFAAGGWVFSDGAIRTGARFVYVTWNMRDGVATVILGRPRVASVALGPFEGRGWRHRLVAAVVEWVRAHDAACDAAERREAMTTRDRNRVNVFRAILRPDSGASESERMQAAQHLARMGEA